MTISHSPAGTKEKIAVRRLKVLELRMAGAHMRAIAAQVGVSAMQVRRDLAAELAFIEEKCAEKRSEVLRLELERLDALYLKAHMQARQGNLYAIDRCLNIMNRRAEYLGLDAPSRVSPTSPDGKGPAVLHVVYDEEPRAAGANLGLVPVEDG
jgi:hypothetical protein